MRTLVESTISNLYAISAEIEKTSNEPYNINTEFSYALQHFSYDLYKGAKELEEHLYIWEK